MYRKNMLLVGSSLVFAASPAIAATADRAAPVDDEEIVVTATLRAENVQSVPIAVTAMTAEVLDRTGVKDMKGLDNISASFNLNSSNSESGGTTMRIRGVGTTGNNTGLESAVGIFLDGVYLSRPGIALGDLLDVEQVELLRGPQGTLFGRNTSSGALSIKTQRPRLDAFEGFANATFGNFDLHNVQGGVSGPIVQDQLGFRLSGAWRQRDGFIRNATGGTSNDQNRYIIRGQLLWEPNADVSVRVIADHSKSDERCCDGIILRDSSWRTLGLYATNGLPADGGVSVSGPQALKNRLSANNAESFDMIEQSGISAQVDWKIEDADFVWITGYRASRAESRSESDFSAVNVFSRSNNTSSSTGSAGEAFTKIRTFTQEARLTGSLFSGRFDYLVGAYYADEDISEVQSLTMGPDHQAYVSAALSSLGVPGPNPARNIFAGGVSSAGSFANNYFSQSGRNWSVFTNNTIHLTDRFAFNFGLRYSNDRKHGTFSQLSASSPACAAVIARTALLPASLQPLAPLARALTCFPFAVQVGQGPTEFDRVFKDENLIYTGKLTAKLAEDVNGYVSFNHGYKAGGFNLDPTAATGGADPRFKPEQVDAYELGVKSQFFNRRLTANLAVFHQNLTDFQVLDFTGVQFFTFNVPKAKSTGFELELLGRVTPELTLNGSATFSNARYPKDCGGAMPAPTVETLCGHQLTNAPKWVLIGGFAYNRDVGSDLTFGLNANVRYETKRRTSTQPVLRVAANTGTEGPNNSWIETPFDFQKANARVNLRATLGSRDERWRVEVWGNNVFNEQTYNLSANTPLRGVSSLPGPANAGGISVSRVVLIQEPRTYGVTLRTKF